MKRLLLHCCCAPCTASCLDRLTTEYDVECLFYNPNIVPYEEYERRAHNLQHLCAVYGLQLSIAPYVHDEFLALARDYVHEAEGGKRCSICFALRLGYAATVAKERGFDAFCTTLTASSRKNAQAINALGQKIGAEKGIEFLSADFKKQNGALISKEICTRYGIYRQNYCGCTPRD